MIDKELIEQYRKIVKPIVASRLLKTNYEGMGEQDKEEFERDFDEILDLALIGLKYKAQLSREGTTKDTTSDLISRQAVSSWFKQYGQDVLHRKYKFSLMYIWKNLMDLPSAQPERKTGHWIQVAGMNECCSACNKYFPLSYFTGRPFDINYCPNCGADMRGEQE